MTSDLPLRPITPEDFAACFAMSADAFGEDPREDDRERERSVFELDRSVAAFDGARPVATAAFFTTSIRVPGGELPCPVVTWVAVARGYRRRGLLGGMMGRLLDDARERGEPLAALFASEASIYGRYGFGSATTEMSVTLERRASAFRSDAPATGSVRSVDLDQARALFPPVYAAVRADHLAVPARTAAWWDYQVLADPPHQRGGGRKQFAVSTAGERVEGYVVWRLKEAWRDELPDATVEVVELVVTTPAALGGLWRYCLDTDLAERVVGTRRPRDEPLALLLADPRRLVRRPTDGLWLRFVDLPAALGGRAWTGTDRLVLDVADPFRPDQGGLWALAVEDGRAEVTRGSAQPDLELDTEALAACYLGDTRARALRAAGRLRECRPGAAQRLDALLGVTATPWAPEVF